MDVRPARTIFDTPPAAGIADLNRPCMDANAQPQISSLREKFLPVRGQFRQLPLHPHRRPAGQLRMLRLVGRRVPHRRQAVAKVIDHHAVVVHDRASQTIHHLPQ